MLVFDAILLGGGRGQRYSNESSPLLLPIPKQFQELGDKPVFVHALNALLGMDCFRQIVFVVPTPFLALAKEQVSVLSLSPSKSLIHLVPGGDTRQESSRKGMEALEVLSPLPSRILIHDACRPYLSREFAKRIKGCLNDKTRSAWIPGVPVTDTIKRTDGQLVLDTVPRENLFRIQTPQIFVYSILRSLFERLREETDICFTDDASLCEYFGIPVAMFEGDVRNIKLTYPFEREVLRALLSESRKEETCVPESVTTSTV